MAKAKKETVQTPEERLLAALVPDWEQPYKVPKNWCWTKIGYLCNLLNGKAFKPTDWADSGLPIIRIQNLNNPDAECNYYSGNVDDSYLLNGDELLFAWSGTPGTSFGAHIWWGKKAVLNQHIFKVKFDEERIDKRYFKYAINQQLDWLISVAHGGAGLQHVTKGVFESTSIPLPPLAEQQRIVERIESLFAKLDEAKEKAQAVLDSLETRRAAILHQAFTGELTAKWREEQNIHGLYWEKAVLSDVVEDFRYGTSEKSEYENQGIPVIRIPNIADNGIDFSDIKYLAHDNVEVEGQIHEGDILIIRSNGSRDLVGKCAIVPKLDQPYAYASFLIRIRPSEKIIGEYLVQYLNSSEARSQMFKKAKSSAGINNINSKEFGVISLPVPSIYEQREIVRILDDLFAKEQQAKEAVEAVLEQIDLMKKSILARAFRGDLGTNNPADEPAIELLKRVLDIPEEPKSTAKRTRIPKELEAELKSELERKLIKLYFQKDTDRISMDELMGISSRKFDILEALRNLEQRSILEKQVDKFYKLLR